MMNNYIKRVIVQQRLAGTCEMPIHMRESGGMGVCRQRHFKCLRNPAAKPQSRRAPNKVGHLGGKKKDLMPRCDVLRQRCHRAPPISIILLTM